jgi:hypothetical protein
MLATSSWLSPVSIIGFDLDVWERKSCRVSGFLYGAATVNTFVSTIKFCLSLMTINRCQEVAYENILV